MKTIILVKREDEALGEEGLVVKGLPDLNFPMVAIDGVQIAHDILEHVNGIESIGSIDDELEALGGIWFVRGRYNDISRSPYYTGNAIESLSYDISSLGELYIQGIEFKTPVPKTKHHIHDQDFQDFIKEGMRKVDVYENTPEIKERLIKFENAALNYIRRGYNKAKRIYKDHLCPNSLFWMISDEIDQLLKDEDFYNYHDTFKLKFDKMANVLIEPLHYNY